MKRHPAPFLMDDAANPGVTSSPPWGNMTSLLYPSNRTSDLFPLKGLSDVSTLANVTQCLFNATVNSTLCDGGDADVINNGTESGVTTAPEAEAAHSLWLTIFLGVLAALVSIVTVLGNMTVLLAFGLERSIRQPTNYFIASLAVSDLLIGTFSMPLYTQYLLLSYWPLGPWLCDIWLSLDWTVCLTSQYTVFFITMDRFLSVKIPAKYRNWRTERKVLVMVGITWVLPTVVFFTTIIGWQYFVGERKVKPKTCEVQFMSDPLFTFLLTIGYYWITLFVMCVLYGGIYKVALELQRKSDAKQRKLESTMEMAAERHSGPRTTASNSSDSDKTKTSYFRKRQKKKSIKASDIDGSVGNTSGVFNNVSRQTGVTTTSFSGRNNLAACDIPRHDSLGGGSVATDVGDNKDEDRSSSPAFASDDEGSSSGATPGSKSPKGTGFGSVSGGQANSNRRSTKSSLNPKAGIAGIVNTAMLTTPESFRTSLMDNNAPPAVAMTLPSIVTDQPPAYSEIFLEEVSGIPMVPSGQCVKASHGGPNYTRLDSQQDSSTDMEPGGGGGDDLLILSDAPSITATTPTTAATAPPLPSSDLLLEPELQVCPYIDENSFFMLTPDTPLAQRPMSADEVMARVSSTDGKEDSPLWKRRNSLPLPPLASDIFDIVIDDDLKDMRVGSASTTALPPSSSATAFTPKLNGGQDVAAAMLSDLEDVQATDRPACGGGELALQPHQDENKAGGDSDSQNLSDTRRSRSKADGRIHSFVKSVRSRNSRRRNRRERKSKSENRARKALRTITIILGAFVLCWTPYHIMLFVVAMCRSGNCINVIFYNFTYWLCYLNSPINPFCYAFANAQFKRTFLRILRFDWHRT